MTPTQLLNRIRSDLAALEEVISGGDIAPHARDWIKAAYIEGMTEADPNRPPETIHHHWISSNAFTYPR